MDKELLMRVKKSKLINFAARCALGVILPLNRFIRNAAYAAHFFQYIIEWGMLPDPEWFDHNINHYYDWRRSRNPLWLERGIVNSFAIRNNARVLELCCGDGFNAYHFYSIRASTVHCLDFDKTCIKRARKNYSFRNIRFEQLDIRNELPPGNFDNVIWDAAIEHFTKEEIRKILDQIRRRLAQGGILSGYTIVEKPSGLKSLEHHEYEFKSKTDLCDLLSVHFPNVKVFETVYPSRHNLYFYASNGTLPFDDSWECGLAKKVKA